MKIRIGRLLIGLVATVVLLGAAAAYLLHAPKPPVPARPVELVTTEYGGRVRTYATVAPAFQQPGAGVLLVFHRSQSSGSEMRRIVGGVLERIAERDNVIVERLVAARAVDARRIYALGDSNGAHMAIRLAVEAPELIAGIVAIGAGIPAADNMDCRAVAALPRRVILVAGTEDPINPYEGGPVTLFGFGNRGDVLSARESAEWFAGGPGIGTAFASASMVASGLTARHQDWIAAGGRVRLLTIEGGGHTIPQAAYRFPRIFGATFQSDAILESTWRFLAEGN
jgi:polyhydroxybutyrate depolymerase